MQAHSRLLIPVSVLATFCLLLAFTACGGSSCTGCSSQSTSSGSAVLYAVSPNGLTSSQIVTLPLNLNTGALGTPTYTQGPQGQTLASVTAAGSQFLYLSTIPTEPGSAPIYGYSIDQTSGALTALSSAPFSVENAITLNGGFASNGFYYVGGVSVVTGGIAPTVNVLGIGADGSLAPTVTGSPFIAAPLPSSGLAGPGPWLSVQSSYLYAAVEEGDGGQPGGVAVFTVDAMTGELAAVSGSPFSTGSQGSPGRLVYDSGRGPFLYVTVSGGLPNFQTSIAGFSINQTTGALTPVPGSPFAAGALSGLALDASGQFLFATDNGNPISEFQVQTDGSLTPLPGSTDPVFGPTLVYGNFLYAVAVSGNPPTSSLTAFSIDETTGALSSVAQSPFLTGGFLFYDMAAVTLPNQ